MAKQRTDTEAVINLVINGKQAHASVKELTDTQRKLNAEMRNMKPADPKYNKLLKEVQMVNKAIDEQKKKVKGVDDESKKLQRTWLEVTKGILGANAVEKAWSKVSETIGKVVDAYAEAQKNRAVLTNAFNGDADKANASLKMLMDYASKTPFSMQEAVEGFIKLVNRGIVPTQKEMVKLGDIAASQGKKLDQLIEAVLDAQTGEFERLKEFGIRASKNGDQVAFSFKGITKEVAFTDEAIKDALLSFGEMPGVAKSMEAVSKTISGIRSNIGDTWDQISTKIGESSEGLIKGFYMAYSGLLDFMNETVFTGNKMSETLAKEQQELNGLVGAVIISNENNEVRSHLLTELNSKYPDFLGNLDQEAITTDILTRRMEAMNEQYRQKILLALNEERIKEKQEEYANSVRKEADAYQRVAKASGLSATQLAKMNAEQVKALAISIRNKAVMASGQNVNSSLGTTGSADEYQTQKDLIIIVNGKTKQKKIQEEINDLTGAGAVMNSKYTTEQITNIDKEIAALKKKKGTENEISRLELQKSKLNGTYKETTITKPQKTDDKAIKKALKDAEKEKEEYRKFGEEIDKIQTEQYLKSIEKYDKEEYEIGQRYTARLLKAKGGSAEEKKAKEIFDNDIKDLEKRKNDDILEESKQKGKELIELNSQIFDATASEYEKEYMRILKFYDDLILKAEQAGVSVEGLKDAQLTALMALDDKQKGKKTPAEEIEDEKNRAQEKNDFLVSSAQQASDAIFSIWSNNIRHQSDARIASFEKEREQELSNKSLTDDQKIAINAKYDAKVKEEKKKAWQAEQRASIAQAIINGALAATKVLAQTGVLSPFALPAIAIGTAAQVAIIASQKMPEFAKGVRNFEGGTALVGEKGQEVIEEKNKWWLTDGPTVANLAPGANVYTANETSKMLKENLYPVQNYAINSSSASAAEKSYRTNSTMLPETKQSQSYNLDPILTAIERLAALQQQEASKPIVLEYKKFDEYKKTIETAYNRQTSG